MSLLHSSYVLLREHINHFPKKDNAKSLGHFFYGSVENLSHVLWQKQRQFPVLWQFQHKSHSLLQTDTHGIWSVLCHGWQLCQCCHSSQTWWPFLHQLLPALKGLDECYSSLTITPLPINCKSHFLRLFLAILIIIIYNIGFYYVIFMHIYDVFW